MCSVLIDPAFKFNLRRLHAQRSASAFRMIASLLLEMAKRQAVRFEDFLLDRQRLAGRLGHAISNQRPGRADLKRIASRLLNRGIVNTETRAVFVLVREISAQKPV